MQKAAQVPDAPVARTLDVPAFEAKTKRADFAVVAVTPTGPLPQGDYETDDAARATEVAITFNRAMTELGAAGDSVPDVAVVRTEGGAVVAGTWRWMGTRTAVFDARPRMQYATKYSVNLNPSVKSLDGESMASPVAHNFTFSTPPVRLENASAAGEYDSALTPGAKFLMRFSQPVDVVMAGAHTVVMVGKKRIKVRAERNPKALTDTRTVLVTPSQKLPLNSRVVVQVDAKMRGLEGTLASDDKAEESFHTYEPLQITASCDGQTGKLSTCIPKGDVYLRTNNAVSEAEMRAALRVDGKPVDWKGRGAAEKGARSSYFTVPVVLLPRSSCVVSLAAPVHDRFGQTVSGAKSFSFNTRDYDPEIHVGARSGVLEALRPASTRVVHIKALNMPRYKIETAVVPEDLHADLGTGGALPEEAHLAWKSRIVSPRGPRNAAQHESVSIDEMLAPAGDRGTVALRISHGEGKQRAQENYVLHVTDLALTAKFSPFGSELYTTHLATAQPYAASVVRLMVRDDKVKLASWREQWRGQSDTTGKAVMPALAKSVCAESRCVLLASAGNDTAALDYNDYKASGAPAADLYPDERMGTIFTERDLYKRGETVRAKAVLRALAKAGNQVVPGESYMVTGALSDGDAKSPLFKKELKTGAFGDFAFDVEIPKSASLGDLSLSVVGHDITVNHSVSITTYRPAAFKVAVDAETPSAMPGDAISFVARGSYLFGGGMNGAKTHLRATWGNTSFSPPGASEAQLLVGDNARDDEEHGADEEARVLSESDVELNTEGEWRLSLKAPQPKHGAPLSVMVEADVEDFTHQHAGAEASSIVHPADFYMALKEPETAVYVPGKSFRSEYAALNVDGTHRAGVRAVVELVKRVNSCVTEDNGDMGASRRCVRKDTVVGRCDVVTTAGLVSCDLTPAKPGEYMLRAAAKDAKGRTSIASASIYAWGDGEDAYASDNGGAVTLVADKRDYKPGDKASVFVRMPFTESDAIVSIERAGVYTSFRTHLAGAMPHVELPITGDMGAGAYVVVELLRGRVGESKGVDVGAPQARYGHVSLPIDVAAHKLAVTVEGVQKSYAPGEKVELDVQVLAQGSKPASAGLTVYAVDEGVLMLSGYKTPDLLARFVMNPGYHVSNLDSREQLAPLFMPYDPSAGDKGGDGGGGGDEGSSGARKDFRSTVFFSPDLVTDSRGKAHVSFTLPDGLSSYRLMAVAMTKQDQYGAGEAALVVSKKLMARPAMPRYAYAGDLMRGGIVVTSALPTETTVKVRVIAEGATLEGESERKVAVKARGSVEAVWPVRVANVGTAKLRFEISGGGESDKVELSLDVRAPLVPEAVSLYNETDSVVRESLASLGALRSDYGGLEMSVASGPIVGLQDALKGVWDYPYGCSEQLTTKIMSTFAAEDLQKRLGLSLPKDAHAKAEEAVATVLSRQDSTGAIGWYGQSEQLDCRLTAYAAYGLSEAKKRGISVPEQALKQAVSAVRDGCHGHSAREKRVFEAKHPGAWIDPDMVFAHDMLAMLGAADPGFLSELYAGRSDLNMSDVALLAHAMKVAGMGGEQVAVLRAMIETTLKPGADGTARRAADHTHWYSDAETAHVLRALIALDAEHPMLAPTVKLVMSQREHGSWRNTHATAWSLMALRDAAEALHLGETKARAEAFVGTSGLLDALFDAGHAGEARATLSMADLLKQDLTRGLTVRATGGRVYTAATLRYARKEMPLKPVESGIYLEGRMGTLSRTPKPGDKIPPFPAPLSTQLLAGDLVAIDIEVTSDEDIENAVVVAPIPAGLEAVRTDLNGEAGSVLERRMGQSPSSYDDHEVRWYTDLAAGLHHFRVLARATTRGTYVVPPMRAESMYNPDVFGRTAGGKLEVK